MDWGRFLAAMAVDAVRSVEEKRLMQIQGLLKSDQLSTADWEAIARHERILEEWPVNPA